MYQVPIWLAVVFGVLILAAGLRRLRQLREHTRQQRLVVDDNVIAAIIERGNLSMPEDEPLDEEEIRRAEEEFWQETWEEPEHYGR